MKRRLDTPENEAFWDTIDSVPKSENSVHVGEPWTDSYKDLSPSLIGEGPLDDHKDGSPVDQRITTYTDLPAIKIREKTDEAKALVRALEPLVIEDPSGADQFGGLLKEVHQEVKELDAMRLQVGAPARGAQKDINDFFKPAIKNYTHAKDLIKRKLEDYAHAIQRENARALELASKGDAVALARVVPETPAAGTATRKEVMIEILNFDEIPREYLCVDRSKLLIMAKAGEKSPPGVVFVWDTKVVVGR